MKRFLVILFLIAQSLIVSAQTDSVVKPLPDRLGLTVTLGLNSLQSVGQAPGFTFGLGNEYFVTDKVGIRPQVFYSAFSYRLGPDIYEETYVIEIPLHVVVRPF